MESLVASINSVEESLEKMRVQGEAIVAMSNSNGVEEKNLNNPQKVSNWIKHKDGKNQPKKRVKSEDEEGEEEGESTDADTSDDEEEGQPLESDALIALTNLEFANNGNNKRKRNPEDKITDSIDPEEWKPINGKKRKKKKKATEQSQRKSKWLVAAVQVLNEESEKGIYAMGVSQIWTKIRDAGLMDFQGKTPRNSLSSALSAAKSKGSNSVIVYNEGLYALRKYKHKLEEGRSVLTTADQNINPIIRLKNICWETLPEEETPKNPQTFQWVGGSIYKKGNRTYYGAARVDGIVYRVSECAHFASAPDERPYLGHIIALFEDDTGAYVEVIWYFFPEDTHCGRTEEHLRDEVFMGEAKDTSSIDAIEAKAEVLCSNDYNKRVKQGHSLKNVYVCKAFYLWETNKFQTLKLDEDIKSTIVGYPNCDVQMNGDHKPEKKPKLTELQLITSELQAKGKALEKAHLQVVQLKQENEQLRDQLLAAKKKERILPINWPIDIIYTPTLIWDSLTADAKQKVYSDCIGDVEIRPVMKKSHPAYTESQLGLFTKKNLPKDTIIGEYTGFVQQRIDNSKHTATLHSDDGCTVEIDASKAGNETRFINDFRGKEAEPNVKYRQMRFGGCWHVFVVTIKDIESNQEVVADLGSTRWIHETAAS